MKNKVFFFLFLVSQFVFAQKSKNKIISPKEALQESIKFKEKASWFTNMPQYNSDSSSYYIKKSLNVLSPNEPLHQNQYLGLKFQEIKSQKLSLAENDSLLLGKWKEYENLNLKIATNRYLQYDYLVYWANIKLRKGDPKKSLELFEKALALINKKDPPDKIARTTLDKALYYGAYGLKSEKELSFKYLYESLDYYQKEYKNNPAEYYMVNGELYFLHTNKNDDSANYYLKKIKLILDIYKKPTVHIWYYSSIGSVQIGDGEYEKAKENIEKALKICETYDLNPGGLSTYCLELLGQIDNHNKDYDAAIANYQKAYEQRTNQDDHYGAINVLQSIATNYEEKGDLANALLYKEKFYTASIASEKELNSRSLRESELKVDVLEKDKELIQKSNQQIFFIVILSIGAIMLLLVYRNVRLKQKNNKKLASINQELESKNNLLDKKNAENELLLKEIHHRVKNNLEVVSGLLALQSSQIDDQSTKDAMQESQNRVHSIGIVHQKLYQGTNLGAVEMKDYVLNLSESILDSFGATGKVKLELAMEKLDLDIDTAVPLGLIINELITNTVKYAFPNNENGTLTIKLEKTQDTILQLVVSDNGVGKSGITHGTGFGGQLISLLTNQLNGTLTEENENGTTVIIDFKIKKTA